MNINDLANKWDDRPCKGDPCVGLMDGCGAVVGNIAKRLGWKCCLKPGHDGYHAACGFGHNVIVWEPGRLIYEEQRDG